MRQEKEGFTLMKTDWSRSHTSKETTFLFNAYGGVSQAWDAINREKKILNGQANGKRFYWIKYL